MEVGGTFALAIGGEASISADVPWWANWAFINPIKNMRLALYGQGRLYLTYKQCYQCRNGNCRWSPGQACLRGEVSVNLSLAAGTTRGTLVGFGMDLTLWEGERCWDL